VTQGDSRVSLPLVAKTSSGCKACFNFVRTSERLPYADHVRYVWSGTVTPHVTESLIKSLKLKLCLKARANQVIKV
jgi:hypothetical protein